MANRRIPQSVHDFPTWARTAGAARDEGTLIQITCRVCGVCRPIDLDRVIAAKGSGYSLINRAPRCTLTPFCGGRMRLSYKGHGCMRHLETEAFADWLCDQEREARRAMVATIKEAGDDREEKRIRDRR